MAEAQTRLKPHKGNSDMVRSLRLSKRPYQRLRYRLNRNQPRRLAVVPTASRCDVSILAESLPPSFPLTWKVPCSPLPMTPKAKGFSLYAAEAHTATGTQVLK